jgi:hypothetical protein
MKSWTLIPFYLWKNTCRRWFEYPVSPVSKMLIPALLGFLAVIVLTLFGEIERELRLQLEKASVYSVYVSEFVGAEDAPTVLRKSYEDELMWTARYGPGVVRQLRQPLASALWNRNLSVPVYSYTSPVEGLEAVTGESDFPVAWLLTEPSAERRPWEEVTVTGKRTLARTADVPPWIRKGLSVSSAVMAPVEMVEPLLNKGFINHMMVNLTTVDEVQRFVTEVRAYYRADQRQVKIVSALDILKNLQRITDIQRIVRTLIVVGCGVILALTLGSIAWLEYRQDAYLLALLKSFGTPSFLLLLHMFFENLLLVLAGILLARLAWTPLFEMALPRLHSIGLHATEVPALPSADLAIIVLAGVVGVVLAMIPVAFGLRRPAGLILQ